MFNLKKNFFDFIKIKTACFLTSNVIDYISSFIILGITELQIDKLCYIYITKFIKSHPATLKYFSFNYGKFPGSLCISLNDIVCHGTARYNMFKVSDIINIDVSIIKNGYFGDCSRMYSILVLNKYIKKFLIKSYICLWKSILIIQNNLFINNIGNFIYNYVKFNKYSVVREYCGHGIGFYFHEFPEILHFNFNYNKTFLKNKTIFTIEPIINFFKRFIKIDKNFWYVKTSDNSLSSQWEHTVFVHKNFFKVLTF